MDQKLKDILRHARGEAYLALAIFVTAIGLSYLEDLAIYLKRPGWLIHGVDFVSLLLFIVDGVYLVSITTIAVYHSILASARRK